MIVRKKIELIVDVEGSGVDYIYQSIIEGMEFNDKQLQFLYGTLNRHLIDLDEVGIDNALKAINSELYD